MNDAPMNGGVEGTEAVTRNESQYLQEGVRLGEEIIRSYQASIKACEDKAKYLLTVSLSGVGFTAVAYTGVLALGVEIIGFWRHLVMLMVVSLAATMFFSLCVLAVGSHTTIGMSPSRFFDRRREDDLSNLHIDSLFICDEAYKAAERSLGRKQSLLKLAGLAFVVFLVVVISIPTIYLLQ